MDKPTLTQEDRELFHYNPNTDDIIERVKAYGDAMAAWGAAQERERIKTLIEQQRGLGYSDDGSDQHLGHDSLVDTLVLLLSAHQGD